MIKYRTGFTFRSNPIDKVEVERETDSSVWIKNTTTGKDRRVSKTGKYENYFDTWEQAKIYLLKEAEDELNAARRNLERAQSKYGNIKGLKKPD